ncbi:MAG TPA: Holliday junction resolvase RuvX [Candidatus Saccharimonadales bacterium]|nr:Holliday junction resolvase RuvX [Candidatus Saccharimonadales bacterium]
MQDSSSSVMSLDVGGSRIGVALANVVARIASPLTTLDALQTTWVDIARLVEQHRVVALCVGLPRGLDGQETDQTRTVRAFADELQKKIYVHVYLQDEAVTSRQAEAELQARGKPYVKGDIDALAATYILEDFLRDHPEALEL